MSRLRLSAMSPLRVSAVVAYSPIRLRLSACTRTVRAYTRTVRAYTRTYALVRLSFVIRRVGRQARPAFRCSCMMRS